MATTPLQLWTGLKAKLAAISGWWETATVYLNRRPPNGASPPYVVATVEMTKIDQESDGACFQEFDVEIVGRAVGPADTETIDANLPKLDGFPGDPTGGITLTVPNIVTGIFPQTGKLRTMVDLKDGGNDQHAPGRRWTILVSSGIGV